MNAQIVDLTIEEEAVKYPNFRLLRGGKGPPINGNGENWLAELKQNCIFACAHKGQNQFIVGLFRIVYKHKKTIIIADALGNQPTVAIDPVEFCKKHDFFELIEEGGILPVGETDGNSKGALLHSRVDDDEDAEGRQPEHE